MDNNEKIKDKLYSNSAIGIHLIENQYCFENYDVNRFEIVSKARIIIKVNTDLKVHRTCL